MITNDVLKVLKDHKDRNKIILIGMETHVCVLQTFLDLKEQNYQIYALADAITSIRSW
jgi:nicotinamidase-related amidase